MSSFVLKREWQPGLCTGSRKSSAIVKREADFSVVDAALGAAKGRAMAVLEIDVGACGVNTLYRRQWFACCRAWISMRRWCISWFFHLHCGRRWKYKKTLCHALLCFAFSEISLRMEPSHCKPRWSHFRSFHYVTIPKFCKCVYNSCCCCKILFQCLLKSLGVMFLQIQFSFTSFFLWHGSLSLNWVY